MSKESNHRRLSFSLRELLIIMSLVAVGFASYSVGRRGGYQDGERNASREWQANYAQMQQHNDILEAQKRLSPTR